MKKAILTGALALALAACSGSSSSTGSTTAGTTGSTAGTTGHTTSGTTTGSTAGTTTGGTSSGTTTGSTSGGTIDPGCGTVTVQGSCNGNTATFCAQGDLPDGGTGALSVDCNNYLPNSEPAQCGTVSAEYGVDCEAPTGQPCAFQDQSGNPIFVFCQGTTPGCYGGTGGFTCQNSTACANFADGGFAPTCAGNQLQVACQVGQAVGYDCAGLGGTCSNAQCVGLPAGAPCDPSGSGTPLLVCASGNCAAAADGGGSHCQ